jgi:hypothetical protein
MNDTLTCWFSLAAILQCSLETSGSWTLMSQFSALPSRQDSDTSGKVAPSAPERLMTTIEPWNGIVKRTEGGDDDDDGSGDLAHLKDMLNALTVCMRV